MKRLPLLMMMVCFAVLQLNAQNNNATVTKEAPNFFIITTDGLRWQELFNGMQELNKYNKNKANRPIFTSFLKAFRFIEFIRLFYPLLS